MAVTRAETLLTDVAAVRRFNRFYTRQAGLIEPKHLHTDVSLPEARILYELAQNGPLGPTDLARDLGIDPGQLSRTVQALQRRQLLSRKVSSADRRQAEIALTAKGRKLFAELDKRSQQFALDIIAQLPGYRRAGLVDAMGEIERALAVTSRPAVNLRPHRPGDIGWIVSRNGALYAEEYGWTIEYEALAAEIAGLFIKTFDPERERCWIAEVDGKTVGSVMLVNAGNGVGKLRLLLVEPQARGLGVGKTLVGECIRFAREAGYTSMTLWTQSILTAARGIYKAAGFRLVDEKPHHSFGHDLIGETWEMDLDRSA
ncbi:bifunctional helix-turn-helix transcriptional regulator/GNAT family N-acetyltransferase [Bradyrhizobium sp. LHD-71]|uniref:bifunctional helix-turn-helix transcriptional regulator/GNAT family N-acetyltransferase n=1 Tax=Bradyrhizobium sp. LHD-71 TaxID=3072141 RepID=UPI00280C99A1|nr:bifunctional helix-turn-helix transcriptional regulator/GNAT family N-acetyltransferase [Bradyrhizobium sp. LHD-71]MDQ8730769.1 bifunctional helix-turn-helix transcriptional regulator/GNAT family N-acetyltransferase [Bradyrhizobium sp. LHD-71]